MEEKYTMKKFTAAVIAALLVFAFAGCSKKSTSTIQKGVLKVGATPEPHAEILNLVKDDLKAEGIDLTVVEFTDYVTPNDAVDAGDIDANYFQHLPYMDSFNKEKGYHLVNAGGIHVEPIVLYSKKVNSLDALADGAEIAIPNDPTNEGRALLLLQAAGLITLKAEAGITATPLDVTENAKNLKFREIEAASLPRVLSDVDAAVINGNYAIPAGLSAEKDGLFVEGKESPYVNVIAVNDGNQDAPEIKALVKALQSDKVREWIKEKYPNNEVVAVF